MNSSAMDRDFDFEDDFYACEFQPTSKPMSPPYQVSINFVYKTDHYKVILSDPDEYNILEEFVENQQATHLFPHSVFWEPSALYPVLSSLGIDPTKHGQIADEFLACRYTLLGLYNNIVGGHDPSDGNVFSLVVYITRTHIRGWFNASMAKNTVPATEKSIEELLKVRVVGDGEEDLGDHHHQSVVLEKDTCRVCLDEFCKGTYALVLPCSHKFHQNCIVTWLRKSHYCPLCRFQMPTRNDLGLLQ